MYMSLWFFIIIIINYYLFVYLIVAAKLINCRKKVSIFNYYAITIVYTHKEKTYTNIWFQSTISIHEYKHINIYIICMYVYEYKLINTIQLI